MPVMLLLMDPVQKMVNSHLGKISILRSCRGVVTTLRILF